MHVPGLYEAGSEVPQKPTHSGALYKAFHEARFLHHGLGSVLFSTTWPLKPGLSRIASSLSLYSPVSTASSLQPGLYSLVCTAWPLQPGLSRPALRLTTRPAHSEALSKDYLSETLYEHRPAPRIFTGLARCKALQVSPAVQFSKIIAHSRALYRDCSSGALYKAFCEARSIQPGLQSGLGFYSPAPAGWPLRARFKPPSL